MSTFLVNRRTLLGGGAVFAMLGLAACSSNTSDSSASAGASVSSGGSSLGSSGAIETKLRDSSGYHLNELTDGAPTVTLFTDFQCPYCKNAESTYQSVAGELAGVMNVTVKNFPLASHRYAVWAACAVQAAENQGMHLAMSNKIFAEQENWGAAADTDAAYNSYFAPYAQELGLDMERFKTDYSSDETIDVIAADHRSGQEAGVRGTPSFVVEGTLLESVDSSTSLTDMVSTFKSAAGV